MDFQTFFSIFERCKGERNGEGLADIFKNSRKYFQNISGSESGYVLATLLDVDNGILRFLRDELDKGIKLKIYETVIIQGFRLVEFVMEQFQNEYEPYIIETKELCEFIIKIRSSHFIKRAATSLFKKIVQLFTDFELFLSETVEKFGKTLHRYDEKERSEIFIIMAVIAKHNSSDVERFSNAIFKSILEDMKVQFKDIGMTQSARFQEYFDALRDLMECFTPYHSEEKNNQYYQEIYKFIKDICKFDEETYELNPGKRDHGVKFYEKKRAANNNTKSAVELLIRHWPFFGAMIYKDYKFWQIKFEYLLKQNGRTGELGWRAMKAFYNAIAQLLRDNDTNEERSVLLYFREYFLNYLTRLDLDSSLLQLIVWAYSQMAAPCKKHLTTNEIYDMYSFISRRSISLYTSDDAKIEEIYSYVESISEILVHLPNVSVNQIKLLSKLATLLIKRFPELKRFVQPSATKALIKSITNVGYLNQNLQQEYFYDLVYNGIIWTCSNTLYIDAELARSTMKERPICYKNYLPLWEEIFNLQYYRIETGPQVIKHLSKELFSTCISLINTLNLQVQSNNETMFSDISLSMTAENETDFRIFVNMVDLYKELFEKLDSSQINDWLPKLLYEIVKNSYKHPMVSGFYKLAHTILRKSEKYWNTLDETNETFKLISKFLSNTLDLICGFYHELQVACVYLILDAPLNLVEDKLKETIPIFKIALTTGLSDFSLAACALDALEQWTRELAETHSLELKEFLQEIIPYLEPYLQSKESETELLQDILKTQRKNISQVQLKDESKTLEEFQRRILLFLGSLSSEITENFIHKSSQNTKATWDKKDLLEYTLFFPDRRLHIHFDRLLPRVIELSLSSGDRRTRICACEVLHSIIVIILGKTRDIINRPNPDRFASLYKILCPAMLKLGSDSDLVVRQLYCPTLLQLSHWLSSKLMLKSPSTIYFVDSLFDSLTDESNSALRDFSGLCLKEFVDWSIKQSSDRELANSSINIHTIVRKICTYAQHPSQQRRIAAAIAFNHLYSSLREREEILNVYWLEIFYSIVKSSEGCENLGIASAIGHLEKVLKIKAKLFNVKHSKRRKPIDLESGTLKSILIWLLEQCGSLDRGYRKSCMKLFENLQPFVDDLKGGNLVSFYVKTHGMEGFNSIFLDKLRENISEISLESVRPLLRALDCYIWFMEKKLIDFNLLFNEGNPEKDLIFSYTTTFVKCFMNRMEIQENSLFISKELELLKTLTCETIETLFSFCHKILKASIPVSFPDFWSQDLFSLISVCVLNPQEMGFDTKNLQIMESLPGKLNELLDVLKNKSPETLLEDFLIQLSRYVEKYYKNITTINIDGKIEVELKFNINGMILLENRKYLDLILKEEFQKKKFLQDIFDILQRDSEGSSQFEENKKSAVLLKPETVEYLSSVLKLVLVNYDQDLIEFATNLLMNGNRLINQDMTTLEHGDYFLSVFKVPLFDGMLKNIQETMKIMENSMEKNPDKLLMILEELVIFTQKCKKNYALESEALANELLRIFPVLKRIVSIFEHREKQFTNIYRLVVRLKRNPLEITNKKHELYLWILNKLQENIDLEKKASILDDFLICLTDMTNNSTEVSLILGYLKNDRLNVDENNISSLKIAACFQTMLSQLPLTKSTVLYEAIINFAAGYCEQLFNEKTSIILENYFQQIGENVLTSLNIAYKLFMNSGALTVRFDILRRFLLPSFQFSKSFDIENFFVKNAKDIYSSLLVELKGDAEEDLRRQIVSKIGAYNLFEILFARVDLEKITSTESRIAGSIFQKPTEKELMVKLLKQTLAERKTKCLHESLREITRLLHCAAYNCHISIISLKEEEKFYSWTFAENKQEGSLIWENIIDRDKKYSLRQTFKEYPKQKKKLINIKKREKSTGEQSENFIFRYNLASSTLVENIDSYDFNEATLLTKNQEVETMSLTFECDDFNEHECMAPLSGILIHMVRNNIFIPQEDTNNPPKWMGNFFRSLNTNYDNVRLFLLKVICNTQDIFKPYMEYFLGIILNVVNEFLKGNFLNYIITDVLLLLVDWQVKLSEKYTDQAQILLEHLVTKSDAIQNRSVRAYNVELIKMILQSWGDRLKLPEAIKGKMETAPEFAIHLIFVFLDNKLHDQVIGRADLVEFVQKSLDDWKREEEVVLQNCTALGLMAKYSENDEVRLKINETLSTVFRQMQMANKSRLIKCIHTLVVSYPPWIENYFEFIRNYISDVDNLGKAKCLEIFSSRLSSLSAEEIKKELGYLNFDNLLKNKILTCESIGLDLIDKLVPIFNAGDMLPLVELAVPYLKNESSELREKAYDIFIKIKNKYGTYHTIEYDENKLRDMSEEILLLGLLDTAENLYEKLINYWTEIVSQPEKLVERLLKILQQYKPEVEQVYLLYFCLSILRLTNKSKEYYENIFNEKLEECSFVDYEILLNWRAKNLGSIAPLFAKSLASQMSQMISQTFSQSSTFSSSLRGQLLRATIDPNFVPTAQGDSTTSRTISENSDVFKMPDPAFNKKSKRFVGRAEVANSEFLQTFANTYRQHDEMVREEVVRQTNVVKLYRKYRYGDFPDIQIPHSSLLIPLQELAKKDSLICKNLVVSIICSLLSDLRATRPRNEQAISQIFSAMRRILENRASTWSLAAVLEITLAKKVCCYEPALVGRATKDSGLYSLGALYLENYMIHGPDDVLEPPEKRRRNNEENQNSEPSIYLARIYKSMNEPDIVLSIFKSELFSGKLQEASLAQSSGDFPRARKSYEEAYEIENDFVKEHCLQESFECLCQLSRWDLVDRKVHQASGENFNNVWLDSELESWLLPWIFRVHLHKILKGDLTKNRDTERLLHFLSCIDDWIRGEKLPQIKQRFGEEMANIYMIPENERLEIARDYLKSSLNDARENWLRLNPLSEKLRSRLLRKLRGISSIQLFFKALKSDDLTKAIQDLMKEWNQHLPSSNDDLLLWETHMNYRMHFASILKNKFANDDDNEPILEEIQSNDIQQKMNFLDFAIERRNNFIAKKYVIDLEETIQSSGLKKLEFKLSTSKCFHLMGEYTNDMSKKLSHIAKSWKYVHNYLDGNESELSQKIPALQHVTTLTSFLEKILHENLVETILSIDFSSKFKNQANDIQSLRANIIRYGLSTLKESCEIANTNEKAECYFKLVTYCYNRLALGGNIEEIREFVSATLKAMIHGSFKAAHYFPCLLKSEYLQDNTTRRIFTQECEKIETWLFITWQSQIFSHLGGPFAELLIPLVDRLVQDYPNAVMYNFRLTIESNRELLTNTEIMAIKEKLYNKPGVEGFLTAMHYVAQPELYQIYHLTEILKRIQQGKSVEKGEILEKLFPAKHSELLFCGALFSQVSKKIENIKNELENWNEKNQPELKGIIKKCVGTLKKSLNERVENKSIFQSKLKDYSPWLEKLRETEIEVPGQYLSNRKPLPRYLAKIGKIESYIYVIHRSIRKPVKLTIVGNDAKNYNFLVKFGEDLRNDQRIQQAFDIMNKILQNDISCAQRHLTIDTYQVIPFSLSLGLIVWIDEMKTLDDFIDFTLTCEERRQCSANRGNYDEWIKKASPGRSLAYKEALLKYNAKAVVAKMNELVKTINCDALRKTFFTLSPSFESFLSLRKNFIATYGTMCTAQWIMGIGDRHLENILISVKSGRCLGIDFGYAFGAGVDISIPEMMPFRLTPQILGLFKPFAENGPFEATMVFVLKALRREKGPLMACLDVFINEPLNWLENIHQFSKENQEELKDVNWLPIKRVATVAQKLDGKKPSLITLEELKLVHGDQKYYWRYLDIVNGTEEDHKTLRAKIKNDNLTAEEQVQCLIDQASDFNILGRTYEGWQPWL